MQILFVTPALDGPATGGTLYNRQLLAALQALAPQGYTFEQRSLDTLPAEVLADQVWVDSLYLSELPALRGRCARIGLLLHYLPSLLQQPELPSAAALSEVERTALQTADAIITPSEYLQQLVQRLIPAAHCTNIEPGVRTRTPRPTTAPAAASSEPGVASRHAEAASANFEAAAASGAPRHDAEAGSFSFMHAAASGEAMPLEDRAEVAWADFGEQRRSALMICNVTENKGVLPLLQELAQVVPAAASFELAIAGSLQLEAAYAQRCLALREAHPWLREHTTFLGSVDPDTLLEQLAEASVLVSASRMESYGMALAEARALGTPILALPGGNIANHVAAESGGQLCATPRELAQALCRLMADPGELAARTSRARATATQHSWDAAAQTFIAAASQLWQRGQK